MELMNVLFSVILVFPLLFGVLWLHSLRLYFYLDKKVSVIICLKAISMSLTLGLFIPARIGEVIKPIYISKFSKIDSAEAMGAVVIERLVDIFSFIIVCFSLSLLLGYTNGQINTFYMVVFMTGFAITFYMSIKFNRNVTRMFGKLGFRRLSNWLAGFFHHLLLKIEKITDARLMALGLVAWTCSFFIYALFFMVVSNFEVNWFQSTVLFFSGTIGLGLAVTPGGLGTFEAAIAGILYTYNFTIQDALVIALTFRVVISLPAAVIVITDFISNYKFCRSFVIRCLGRK